MTTDNCRLVRHKHVDPPDGAYRHWQNRWWAEPDIYEVTVCMVELPEGPAGGRTRGQEGRGQMRIGFGYRGSGQRHLRLIEEPSGSGVDSPEWISAG